ncbi:MAG TPA: lipid II flippase MurJ [Limnobacter sp.]|nr:lipid II flippase MurJ [Limnobacter sp.]
MTLATLLVSALLLMGRLAGYVRELTIARTVGANASSDQIIVLLTLPDLLFNMLIAGGIAGVLVPLLSGKSPEDCADLVKTFFMATFAIFLGAVLVLIIAANGVAGALAPGLDNTQQQTLANWIRLSSPAVIAVACAGVLNAYLNSRNQFYLSSVGGLVMNLSLIAALLLAYYLDSNALAWAVGAIVVGGMIRYAIPKFAAARTLPQGKVNLHLMDNALLKRLMFCMVAVGVAQFTPVIVRSFASSTGAGALTNFNYALKLVELPLTLIASGLATVGLPAMAGHYKAKDFPEMRKLYFAQVRLGVAMGLACLVMGHLLAEWGVRLLFGSEKISETGLMEITHYLKLLLWVAPVYAIYAPTINLLNASDRQKQLLYATLLSTTGAILICYILAKTAPHFVPMGVLASYSISLAAGYWFSKDLIAK